MLIHKPADVLPSEITPRSLFERRRDFLARSGAGLVAGCDADFVRQDRRRV